MIKKMIINADDYGITEGISIGILLAHKEGVLTSTTCMMNMPFIEEALKMAEDFPELGLGVHLNITVGKALVATDPSFVDVNGYFVRPKTNADGKAHAENKEDLYKEWKAQIERFIALTGHKPTHLDSHHHVHLLPWHVEITKRLAHEYDLPIRQREQIIEDYEYIKVEDHIYGDDANIEHLHVACSQDIAQLELMCHPGLLDQQILDMSSYALPRTKELDFLRSQEIKDYIEENHIGLINFKDIKKIKH